MNSKIPDLELCSDEQLFEMFMITLGYKKVYPKGFWKKLVYFNFKNTPVWQSDKGEIYDYKFMYYKTNDYFYTIVNWMIKNSNKEKNQEFSKHLQELGANWIMPFVGGITYIKAFILTHYNPDTIN